MHYYAQLRAQPALLKRLADRSLVKSLVRVRLVMLPSALGDRERCELCLRVRSRSPDASWTTRTVGVTDVRTDELVFDANALGGPAAPHGSGYAAPFQILNSKGTPVGTIASVPVADWTEPCPLPIHGDIDVSVVRADDEKVIFHSWFHAGMLVGDRLVRRKWQLDGAAKDHKHKKYSPHLALVLEFSAGKPSSAKDAPVELSARI